MFEKVNPSHPDKIADRIAGAIVDLAYAKNPNPKVACEVLIGHGECHIINETNVRIKIYDIISIVNRIAGKGIIIDYKEFSQDNHLANNQSKEIRCGDNGIFKGVKVTNEQKRLTKFVRNLYKKYPYDGKFIIDGKHIIACQSNIKHVKLVSECNKAKFNKVIANPIGDWTGGTNVDTGATNRKLGSDMGDAVTGGGLHGKDLSKADVSVNIYCHLLAQKGRVVKKYCSIGDNFIGTKKYKEIVKIARRYVRSIGGFEKLAEWGLIR